MVNETFRVRKNQRLFTLTFREEKYNKNKKQIYYLEKVSADYNVEQSVKDAFERVRTRVTFYWIAI